MFHALDNEKLSILAKRLWEKVEQKAPNECWPWTAARDKHGRGRINVFGSIIIPTHLILYLEGKPRPAPPNDSALHLGTCHPGCCNPAHLRWGSQAENMLDKVAAGRQHRLYGMDRKKSCLTDQDVRDIRNSSMTLNKLAKLYKVSSRAIWDIKKNRSWQHLL